jgi:hypothetical protein
VPDDPRELASWKEIARFLGVTERTAQKWEQTLGLPVRRLPGPKGRVSADAEELARWKDLTRQKPPWYGSLRFWKTYGLVATAVLILGGVVAGVAFYARSRRGPPVSFRLDGPSFVATDAAGRELWRKTFHGPSNAGVHAPIVLGSQRAVWFSDLDQDGRVETLVACKSGTGETSGSVVVCLSEEGEVRWRFVPGRTVRNRAGDTYAPPYLAESILVAGQPPRIFVTSHHLSHYPNQVTVLDASGILLGEYWHSGQLPYMEAADLDGDRVPEILLGGISNGYQAAALVVLDTRNVCGASLEPENPHLQLSGFAPALEKARLLFPRTCINQRFEIYNKVADLILEPRGLRVGLNERWQSQLYSLAVLLDFQLRPTAVDFNDHFRALHRELELAGELDHTLTEEEVNAMRNVRVLRPLRAGS